MMRCTKFFLFLMLIGAAVSAASAQSVLFHPMVDSPLSTGTALHDEIWRATAPSEVVLPRESIAALFGDRNGNGQLDDAPGRFDALETLPDGSIFVSLASNTTLAGGTTLLDGDVFRMDPRAPLTVVWSEAMFASVTTTGTVDVDAFAIGVNGEIYFSFEDDEVTQSPALIAQNGGNATLDEQCVFRLDPGQTAAALVLTQAAVVALFNTAFGTSATSVVDTTGIEVDPLDPSALWITAGTSAQSLRGRIVSTRNGGTPVTQAGVTFEPVAFGFSANFALDSLALGAISWPVLRLTPASGSIGAGAQGAVSLEQVMPFHSVQLFVTAPSLPGPFGIPSSLPGWSGVHVDPADPLFAVSAAAPEFTLLADAGGRCSYGFAFAGMTAGLQAMVQAVELGAMRVSTPAVLTVTI